MLALSFAVASSAKADYAYVSYYHTGEISQVNVTTTTSGNSTNSVATGASSIYSSGGYQPEGIAEIKGLPGMNSTQLYVVNAADGSVGTFTTAGAQISGNILKDASGNTMTLGGGGAAGLTMSPDGLHFYVAMSNGSNSGIYEFDTKTGKEVAFAAFAGAHDITYHSGMIYVTAYQSANTQGGTNTGVWAINANLTGSAVNVIKAQGAQGATPTGAGTNNLYNASGMAFVGNTLFVANSPINNGQDNTGASGMSFVQVYSNVGLGLTPSYFTTVGLNNPLIYNPFGMTAGPDGNIYVSSLGTINGHNGQITQINGSGTVSTWLANSNNGGYAADGDAPKYLTFDSEAPIYGVPEPGSMILTGMGLASFALLGRFRKRKNAA
jgi:hypothetical protein